MVARHAGLGEREADEDADGVERDEPGDGGVGDDDEQGGGTGQRDDPVGEHQAVAPLGELAGEEAVAGLEARQAREVGETGVGGEDEDQHRGGLERVAEHLASRTGAVDGLTDLGEHRGGALLERQRLHLAGEEGETEEHHPEPAAHHHQGLPGVLPRRLAEGRDAVRDRLDTGHRGAAGGERLGEDVGRGTVEEAVAGAHRVLRPVDDTLRVVGDGGEVASGELHDADQEQDAHVQHEEVGGDGKDLAALLDPAEVPVHHDGDEPQGDRHAVRAEALEGGDQRRGAGRHRHRHREDVAHQQGRAGHLGGDDPEVVTGDEVGAPRRRVRLDRLPVGEDQQGEHHQQGTGDRHHQRERQQAHRGHEGVEDLLGGVGAGAQVVGCEHRQGRRLAQALVVELVAVEGRSEELALDPVGHAIVRHRHAASGRRGRRSGDPAVDDRGIAHHVEGGVGCHRRRSYGLGPAAPPVGSRPVLLGQVPPDVLLEVCGEDPSYVCKQMLELTDSERAAETADLLFAKPLLHPAHRGGGVDRAGAPPPCDRPLRRLPVGQQPAQPAAQAHPAPHTDRGADAPRERAGDGLRVRPGRRPRPDPRTRAALHRRLRRVEHRGHHDPR